MVPVNLIPTLLLATLFASSAAAVPQDASPSSPAARRDARVIVVGIDQTFDMAEPFAPEPWWPVGAAILRYFDHSVVAVSGKDVPDLVNRLDRRLAEGGFSGIRKIEVWTHGGAGWFRIQNRRQRADIFDGRNAALTRALSRLRELLAPGAIVHFRSCSTFRDRAGIAFADAAARFFNTGRRDVTVMGHTRPTGLQHPGWQTIPPGGRARWPASEGMFESEIYGVEILARDLLRIFTGHGYEVIPFVRERILPGLAAEIEIAARNIRLRLTGAGQPAGGGAAADGHRAR